MIQGRGHACSSLFLIISHQALFIVSHSQSSVNFLAQPFRLLRLTRRNSFLAPESARLPHRKSRGVGECPASTRPGHAPSPPLRPYSPAACVVITWPGKVLTSRWEGVRRRRKGGGGTRLVVLLPESRILSSCGRAASSLPTMSHLVEPPPPLHNNNNNCEEGEQSLPPPAGLNSEHGAAGLSGGLLGWRACRLGAHKHRSMCPTPQRQRVL